MGGLIGAWESESAARDIFSGLHVMQRRGTKYVGISIFHNGKIKKYPQSGLVQEIFRNIPRTHLEGNSGIGIVGHKAILDSNNFHAQPVNRTLRGIPVSVCLSGVITNCDELHENLGDALFATESFAELLMHLINHSRRENLTDRIVEAVKQLEGSFAVAILTPSYLAVARDPLGNRPLSLGLLPNGGRVIASESSVFNAIDAKFVREIEPGEILFLEEKSDISIPPSRRERLAFCILELLNLSAPASYVYGRNVGLFRKEVGRVMGEQESSGAEIIIPSPKVQQDFVYGFSEASGIPIVPAITGNIFALRQSFPSDRSFLNVRFGIIRDLVRHKSVILLDDIMRSAGTATHLARLVRTCNTVKKIFFRTTCSPVHTDICRYRTSPVRSTRNEYASMEEKNIADCLGVDNFDFLELETLKKVLGNDAENFCFACLNG